MEGTTTTGSTRLSGEADVLLYMYDLSGGLVSAFSPILTNLLPVQNSLEGVWHTAIVAFGSEYYFNGDLVHCVPRTSRWGTPTKVVYLGQATRTKVAFHQWVVDELRPLFTGKYDALAKNCNHFSDECAMFLCQGHVPEQVSELPQVAASMFSSPWGRQLLNKLISNGPGQAKQTAPEALPKADSAALGHC